MNDEALGELAVREGFLSPADLKRALEACNGQRLDATLIRLGILDAERVRALHDIRRILAAEEDAPREDDGEDTITLRHNWLTTSTLGPYTLLEEIDRGSAGLVFRAVHQDLDNPVALKVFRESTILDPGLDNRLRRESLVSRRLEHPNIVRLIEIGRIDDVAFLAMEYIEGLTLLQSLARGRLTPRDQVRILAQASRAVHHAHGQGVIHRDLKPANIIVDADLQPHVADFGLARLLEERGPAPARATGTLGFMPPEQVLGQRAKIDVRSDVYALGAILHVILTGHVPHESPTAEEIRSRTLAGDPPPPVPGEGFPKTLVPVCVRALRHDHEKRHPTALAFAEDLERCLEGWTE